MSQVKGDVPDHTLSLLGQVMDGLRRDVHARTEGPAAADLPAPARGLRSSQLRLLSLTPAEGMRVTDLAERVGMTKQALGEFANALEERGLLESVRDAADRRVRILRLTDDGRVAVEASERVIADVEQRWRDLVGAEAWGRLRDDLRLVVAARRDEKAQSTDDA